MSENSDIWLLSDQAILKEIGKFIKQMRIRQNVTQEQFSKKAAISRSTLSLIERGEGASLLNFIKILRTLDALYVLKDLKLREEMSPIQLAKGIMPTKLRASSPRNKGYSRKNSDDPEW